MNSSWILSGTGNRALRLTHRHSGKRAGGRSEPVLTVREVCRRLRKSRRQIYRYLKGGRLTPCARILGQWLFAEDQVARFASSPDLPIGLKPLFWDVQLSGLEATRHRDFILGRILEYGDRAAVRWALEVYTPSRIKEFLQNRGADVLSPRAWYFWASQFKMNARQKRGRRWRRLGRRWGGIEAAA